MVEKDVIDKCGLHEQLLNEIQIMESLQHPNIIKLFGYFEDMKNIYLVMELSEEGSLFQRLSSGGFPEEVAMRVGLRSPR